MNNDSQFSTTASSSENVVKETTSSSFLRVVQIAGIILVLLGAPLAINLLCIVPLLIFNSTDTSTSIYVVASITFVLLTVGVGLTAFIHANRAIQKKPSKLIGFSAHPLFVVAIFLLLLITGTTFHAIYINAGFFVPPILIVCAILPPLWAIMWMLPQNREQQKSQQLEDVEPFDTSMTQISWRQGLSSFAGGATISVLIAIALEIILPLIVLSLVSNLASTLSSEVRSLFRALSNENIAEALTNPSFIYIFIQIAIIAPIAEELAKPLIVLPLLKRLNKQQAFQVGALAGAGFAALENIIYAVTGFAIWPGILLVRSLGGALHPLGSGLVAQGWREVLSKEKDAGKSWLKRFGIAVTVHAVWNGGSLLVITLGSARLFGEMAPEIDLLGFSAAGITLAFLLILGLTALWIGYAYGHNKSVLPIENNDAQNEMSIPSDRAVALWAVACLIAIVPAGIAGLKLWLR